MMLPTILLWTKRSTTRSKLLPVHRFSYPNTLCNPHRGRSIAYCDLYPCSN